MKTTIRFEQHGQDFSEWDIQNGIVTDCRPFQATMWIGRIVLNEKELSPGAFVKLSGGVEIKYPLISVKTKQPVGTLINRKLLSKRASDLICTSVDDVHCTLKNGESAFTLREVLGYLANHNEQKTKFKLVRAALLRLEKA